MVAGRTSGWPGLSARRAVDALRSFRTRVRHSGLDRMDLVRVIGGRALRRVLVVSGFEDFYCGSAKSLLWFEIQSCLINFHVITLQ